MRGQQVAVIEVPEAAGFTPPRAQRGCQFGGRSSVARCGVWLLHYGSALDDVQPFPSLGRLRLMNCHGVAGVPSWSTHRFAPQMHSSMSSRHGKVPGVSLFSAASAGGLCWRRSSAQLTPSPVPAGLFPRAGGQGRAGVLGARVTEPSPALKLARGLFPVKLSLAAFPSVVMAGVY